MNIEKLLIDTIAVVAIQEAKLLMIGGIVSELVEKNQRLRVQVNKELPALNLEIMGSLDNFDCGDPVVNRKVSERAKQLFAQQFLEI